MLAFLEVIVSKALQCSLCQGITRALTSSATAGLPPFTMHIHSLRCHKCTAARLSLLQQFNGSQVAVAACKATKRLPWHASTVTKSMMVCPAHTQWLLSTNPQQGRQQKGATRPLHSLRASATEPALPKLQKTCCPHQFTSILLQACASAHHSSSTYNALIELTD